MSIGVVYSWTNSWQRPVAFLLLAKAGMRSEKPVVVLTSCDHLTKEMRLALVPHHSLAFVESEAELHRRVTEGAHLVLLHVKGSAEDGRVAGRLVRAVPTISAPVIALSDFEVDGSDGAGQSELLDDILFFRVERWRVLLEAWVKQPAHARQRVAELRLLHSCAPAQLLPLLDHLMLVPEPLLSVKKWSAETGVSRRHLYRQIRLTGMTPSEVLDVVRSMHCVGPILVDRADVPKNGGERFAVRTERRVLARTLGMSLTEIVAARESDSREVRDLVANRLRRCFERGQDRPSQVFSE